MSDEARRYLLPPLDAFWVWRDSGDVIAWADEKTIGFRQEILYVLRRLAPDGLPPLGAVVLLLAATRDNWCQQSAEPGILAGLLRLLEKPDAYDGVLVDVLAGLDRVSYLEPELRKSSQAKAVLAELVFEGLQDRSSPSVARDVVRLLEDGLDEEVVTQRGSGRHWNYGPLELLRELRYLSLGLKRVDPEVLAMRLRTGLDQAPQPADLDLPPSERIRRLLAELEHDEEYGGLARLARTLMAAVALPPAATDFEELPVGGVSDICNRGPLDRLLLSELSHDDLTLAVRVALNEALYLRRETPPRTPMRHRAMLLEAGIRSWGVPRVFATAVALALAATADAHTEVVVFRAKGNGVEPVDLTTRQALVSHLEALEPDLHPGAALEAFQAEMDRLGSAAEPILVTAQDVWDDAEFQKVLPSSGLAPFHVATVRRDGALRLVQRSLRGTRLLREARLDLDQIFRSPKQTSRRLVGKRQERDLPAIFSVKPFPLLLPHNFEPRQAWRVVGRGVLAITSDLRLMLWDGRDHGAQEIWDRVPSRLLRWSSRARMDGSYRAVVGSSGRAGMHLLNIDLNYLLCTAKRLHIDPPGDAICSHNSALFAVSGRRVQVIGVTTGEVIETLHLPAGIVWNRDRFFCQRERNRWYALSFNGRTAHLEPVFHESVENGGFQILTLFERDGVDGPIGVTAEGHLLSSVTANLRKVRHGMRNRLHVSEVSADGRRVVLAEAQNNAPRARRRCLVDVDSLAVEHHGGDWPLVAEPFADAVRPINLMHRLTRVGIDRRGMLALMTRKGRTFRLEFDWRTGAILLRGNGESDFDRGKSLTFKPVKPPPGTRFKLKVATWGDGSRAFLDSRGLLHLASADRTVPECSIVLREGQLAGWCSDGRLWGDRYFTGSRQSADQRDIFQSSIGTFAARVT